MFFKKSKKKAEASKTNIHGYDSSKEITYFTTSFYGDSADSPLEFLSYEDLCNYLNELRTTDGDSFEYKLVKIHYEVTAILDDVKEFEITTNGNYYASIFAITNASKHTPLLFTYSNNRALPPKFTHCSSWDKQEKHNVDLTVFPTKSKARINLIKNGLNTDYVGQITDDMIKKETIRTFFPHVQNQIYIVIKSLLFILDLDSSFLHMPLIYNELVRMYADVVIRKEIVPIKDEQQIIVGLMVNHPMFFSLSNDDNKMLQQFARKKATTIYNYIIKNMDDFSFKVESDEEVESLKSAN